jgi:transglutaminase-like putative cysteine protease
MRPGDRNGIAVMISVILATITVLPLTSDRSFLPISWICIIMIAAVSIALRRARMSSTAVLGVQGVIMVVCSVGLSLSMPTPSGTLELPWFQRYPALWADGIEHMRSQASPMDPNDGVTLIFVTTICLIMIMTDLLVSGVHRPAWSIAPPATLFLVPALGLGTDTGVFNFLLIAAGFLTILIAGGLNTTARWTRGLSRDSAEGFGAATPVVWRAAGFLAIPAVLVTILLGVALPTLALPGFGFGNGPGGNGPLQLTDPTLDLRRNLNQPDDRTVIEYDTNGPGGVYLRLASLPQLSAAGWGNVQIRLNSGNNLTQVPGVSSEPGRRRTTNIRVLEFGSQYLPMPYAPRSFNVSGDWRFDANSLVVVNADNRSQDLRRLTYSVESVDIVPDGDELATAPAGTPTDDDVTGDIPSDLPDSLTNLAQKVTAEADSPAEKAAAIQAYLRSSEFSYSTERLPGSGYEALENFLLVDHKGYCEQFASAMAMMARVVGIPSRVSVGFLPGDRDGDVWKVSIRDMHAWPELYFAGYGWVRFEPTPASITGAAPSWTVRTESDPGENPTEESSAEPTENTASQSADPSADPTTAPTTADPGLGRRIAKTVLVVASGLLALLILAAPATIRIRRRSARFDPDELPADQVEAAWAEIRDTVLDYGGRWPSGSPRAIGTELGSRLDNAESASMSHVATLVERSRYARSLTGENVTDGLPEITEEIRHGIAAPQSRFRRALAFLVPRSLFTRRTER